MCGECNWPLIKQTKPLIQEFEDGSEAKEERKSDRKDNEERVQRTS